MLSQEVFVQADEFFKEKKEWYSFLKLCEIKEDIITYWFNKYKHELNKYFQCTDFDEKNTWLYRSKGLECRWYLKELGEESIYLVFQNHQLSLFGNLNLYSKEKIISLWNEPKYKPIISAFEETEIDRNPNSWLLISEKGKFRFNDDYDGNFDYQRLAWHANFNTKELVKQIINKVERFVKDDKITNLLLDLNRETKIKTE